MDSDGPTTVALTVTAEAWRTAIDELEPPDALQAFVERVVRAALESGTAVPWLQTGEVSLLLTDDREIQGLNNTYRAKDRATNVLSFPGLVLVDVQADMAPPPGMVVLGDIVISHERVIAEAIDLGKAPIDHLAHLLVHGVLHLLGYDHDEDRRAEAMEVLEAEILQSLGQAAPYAPVIETDAVETAVMSLVP